MVWPRSIVVICRVLFSHHSFCHTIAGYNGQVIRKGGSGVVKVPTRSLDDILAQNSLSLREVLFFKVSYSGHS